MASTASSVTTMLRDEELLRKEVSANQKIESTGGFLSTNMETTLQHPELAKCIEKLSIPIAIFAKI